MLQSNVPPTFFKLKLFFYLYFGVNNHLLLLIKYVYKPWSDDKYQNYGTVNNFSNPGRGAINDNLVFLLLRFFHYRIIAHLLL